MCVWGGGGGGGRGVVLAVQWTRLTYQVRSCVLVFVQLYPLHENSNQSLPVPNRVPIHQWMCIESIQVTIQVGGVHTDGVQSLL